jgi:hypothetical protein
MNYRIQQEVPQGGKPSITKDDVQYDPISYDGDEPVYPDPLSTETLALVRSAGLAAANAVTGRVLLTIEGARDEGEGPRPEQIIATASRILE